GRQKLQAYQEREGTAEQQGERRGHQKHQGDALVVLGQEPGKNAALTTQVVELFAPLGTIGDGEVAGGRGHGRSSRSGKASRSGADAGAPAAPRRSTDASRG